MAQRKKDAARRAAPRAGLTATSARGSGPANATPASATPASPRPLTGGSAPRHGLSAQETQWLLAITLVVVVSYFPALQGGFVWDDVIFSEEPVIHSPSGLHSIWLSPADIKNEGHYWPLVYTSFWLEHKLWGLNPVGYHAVNILLHLVNCLLLWRLLDRLAIPGAVVIAAVFAIHPMHVESVAWIIERKDVLSALFYLTAVLTWIRFNESPGPGRYALALALFAAGLLAKSVVVTLPVALLIWHWWKYGRVTSVDLLRLAPFVAVGLAITLADLAFYTSREPLELGYSLVERALIAAHALWFYAGTLLWPTNLAVIYPLWEIDTGTLAAWGYLVAAAALAAALWFGRRRLGRGPLAGALFFAVTLAPVLGFIDYGYMQFSLVADRFQYLAGLGVLAVLIGGAAHNAAKLPDSVRRAVGGLAVAAVLVLAVLTWRQAGIYRDEISLFSHIVALNPEARDAHLNLSSALFEADRFEEGLAASRIAVQQRPDSAGALANLGRALVGLQQFEDAERHLRRAVQIDPRSTTAYQNLAEALRKQGRYADAVAAYRAVLAIDESFALAYAGMGTALFGEQRYAEAVAAMTQALSLEPDLPTAGALHLHMGRSARELGRLDEAAQHFLRLMEIEPDNVEPLFDLAKLRFRQGRAADADQLLNRTRELRPADPATLHNIAEALRIQGRYGEAVASYRAALEIDAEFAPAHAGLGIALFQWERYDESIGALELALALQPDLPVAGSSPYVFLGRAAQKLGREDAAEYFARAIQRDPHDYEALDHLALMRFGQQQYEEARALYRTMVEINPDSAVTHSNLGATLYYLGRFEEALESIDHALSLDPDLEIARVGRQLAARELARRER